MMARGFWGRGGRGGEWIGGALPAKAAGRGRQVVRVFCRGGGINESPAGRGSGRAAGSARRTGKCRQAAFVCCFVEVVMAKFEIRENEGKIGVRKVGNVLLKQGQWPRHGQRAAFGGILV